MILIDVKHRFNLFYSGVAQITYFEQDSEEETYTFYVRKDSDDEEIKDYWETNSVEGTDYTKYVYDIFLGKCRNQNNIFSKYLENVIAERT